MNDRMRGIAALVAAVAQIVGSPLGTALAGRSVSAVSSENSNLVTPAGYAFSIWGIIFFGSLAWAIYALLPSQQHREIHRRTGWPLAAAFAGNAIWETIFPFGGALQIVANVLIFAITACSAIAFVRLQSFEATGIDRLLPGATTGLLLGWVTVAPVANVGSTGVYLGAPGSGSTAEIWAVVALVAVAAIGARAVLWAKVAAGPFAVAVIWGVVAIAAAGSPAPVTYAALGAAAVIAGALVGRTLHRRTSATSLLVG